MAFTDSSCSHSRGASLAWVMNVERLLELLVKGALMSAGHMESSSGTAELPDWAHRKVSFLPLGWRGAATLPGGESTQGHACSALLRDSVLVTQVPG